MIVSATMSRPVVTVLPPLSGPGPVEQAHRSMANHVQVLSTMVLADIQQASDRVPHVTLDTIRLRISAIANVYRHLAQTSAGEKMNLGTCLQDLATDPDRERLVTIGGHRVLVEAAAIMVSRDQAAALAVLVCELIGNACRYAYAPEEPGDVKVRLMRTWLGGYRLEVEDRARGLSLDRQARRAGQQMIEAMASRLGGLCCWQDARPGTRFVLYIEARA